VEFPRSIGHLPFAAEAAGKESEMPGPHPREFRRRAVELARELDEEGNRRYPVAQLARGLKISESCLRNWLARDAVEAGERPGLTRAEREELVRLRRENRVLGMERDLLSRAAAFFAQENVLPRQ
jgi:transposase